MRLPKWLVRASVLCFCLLVVLLQRKNIELADARAEKAGQESERSEFAREVNLEYTQGEGVVVNDGDAASSIAVSNEKEQFIEHILRGPKPGKIKDEWRIHPDDRGKFFVYQPTGGWGNQRMILKSAIAAANAMGRVLVLPMISPHGFLWRGYEKFSAAEMSTMAELLDIDELNKVVMNGIKVHNGTLRELRGIWKKKSWLVYEKPRHKNGKFLFFSDRYIKANWKKKSQDVVFWNKNSMFMCCGPSNHFSANIGFNLYLKAFAHKLVQSTINTVKHNAIHVRRGQGHTSFDRRTPQRFYKEHLQRFDKSIPLYIATDEKDKSWFRPFRTEFGFKKLVFWDDLPDSIKSTILPQYPETMRGDLIGFLEQIICAKAKNFAGSHGSTFSAAIMAFRRNKKLRAIKVPEGFLTTENQDVPCHSLIKTMQTEGLMGVELTTSPNR